MHALVGAAYFVSRCALPVRVPGCDRLAHQRQRGNKDQNASSGERLSAPKRSQGLAGTTGHEQLASRRSSEASNDVAYSGTLVWLRSRWLGLRRFEFREASRPSDRCVLKVAKQ